MGKHNLVTSFGFTSGCLRILTIHRNNYVSLLKCVIPKVMKCTAHLKTIFKCVCVTERSLVMSPLSHDLINACTLIKV